MDGIQGRFLKSKSGSVAFKVQSWYEGTKATFLGCSPDSLHPSVWSQAGKLGG